MFYPRNNLKKIIHLIIRIQLIRGGIYIIKDAKNKYKKKN
jgi:hypothetical protein